ncbi:MAG: hypothetical protein PHC80_05365 [Eubacteriales bacterium]|nr:hypothetical protein [Eubacteriales bacterium]
MKSKRAWLFRGLTVLALLLIAAVMFIIGRGHTVYIDNKNIDYNGQTYKGPYKVVVTVDGEQVAKLYNKDRGMAKCIGQKFEMLLAITQEKGGEEVNMGVTMTLPYSMDGIVVNLPALLAGLPQDAYLSEFVSAIPEEPVEEDVVTDEFGIPDAEGEVLPEA